MKFLIKPFLAKSALIGVLAIAIPGLAPAQQYPYTVKYDANLSYSTRAYAINSSGEIAGAIDISGRPGYFWGSPEQVWDYSYNSDDSPELFNGLNDNYGYCGYHYYNGQQMAYGPNIPWTLPSSMTLGGNSDALGLNNSNQMVGLAYLSDGVTYHAVWWPFNNSGADNSIVDLSSWVTPNAANNSLAGNINSLGHVVGYYQTSLATQAMFWDINSSTARPVTDLGGTQSYANAIDDLDEVAGASNSADNANTRAFYNDTYNSYDLGTLGGATSAANGINTSGQVVGYSDTVSDRHGFIWDQINGMQDLNNLIDPATGWIIQTANAINEKGQIAAVGLLNGVPYGVRLDPTAVSLSSLSVTPASMIGGTGTMTGTVTFSSNAPVDITINLSSGDPSITVPASVTIAAGSSSATFTVTPNPVASDTVTTVTASYNGAAQSAVVSVWAPTPTSVTLNQSSVLGGQSVSGTVTLNGPAPTGGLSVTLASANAAAQVTSVSIPAGATSAGFTVTTKPVSSNQTANITASYDGVTTSPVQLTVQAPSPTTVTISPASLYGGSSAKGTVTLNAAAPSGGLNVSLSSDNAAVHVPATITVAGGKTSAVFTITTSAVASNQNANITATYNGVTTSAATLTVKAPQLVGLVFQNPATGGNIASVKGGTMVNLKVVLTSIAPAGCSVSLSSANLRLVPVPPNVTVPANQKYAILSITTGTVSSNTTVKVSGSYQGVTKSANLTVTP